uniref:Pleckstrin homology domain containing B2 n=1 Tax=Macaca nemestrina TaxID=9545 RepID=A0A2K6C052_MACNE
TILKRWKKNWFDLWSDGHLIYYDDQTRQNIEDKVHMPVDCINIRTGQECRGELLILVVCRDAHRCWEAVLPRPLLSPAGVLWGSAVMTDETSVVSSPPPSHGYCWRTLSLQQAYGYGPYSGAYPPGTQVVYAANGQAYAVPYQYPYAGLYGQQPANQVIIREQYRDNDSDLALGMLARAATGMALGSLFWVF